MVILYTCFPGLANNAMLCTTESNIDFKFYWQDFNYSLSETMFRDLWLFQSNFCVCIHFNNFLLNINYLFSINL